MKYRSVSILVDTTPEQFRRWMCEAVDGDRGGKVGRKEVAAALRLMGFTCAAWKAWRAILKCDVDHSGYIDSDSDWSALTDYACKHWGFRIST